MQERLKLLKAGVEDIATFINEEVYKPKISPGNKERNSLIDGKQHRFLYEVDGKNWRKFERTTQTACGDHRKTGTRLLSIRDYTTHKYMDTLLMELKLKKAENQRIFNPKDFAGDWDCPICGSYSQSETG